MISDYFIKSVFDKLNIGNENFLDVLVAITDSALIDVEDDKLLEFREEMLSKAIIPSKEYVPIKEQRKTTIL